LKEFSREAPNGLAEKRWDENPARRSRFSMSGDSCQAVLHGCLPAENAAIHFAALYYTGNKPVAQRYFCVAATCLVSEKKEGPVRSG